MSEGREGIVAIDVNGQRRFATRNLTPGRQVYGEKLVDLDGVEYRVWDEYRSKFASALMKGLREIPVKAGSSVLYLGASTGTTISHISDLVGSEGVIFGVEFAPRVAKEFLENVVRFRRNIVPVISDAAKPEKYLAVFGKVDVVYCDIAQPDQTEIAIKNTAKYLKQGGVLLLAVKASSIDVTKRPETVFKEEVEKLKKSGFEVVQAVDLDPYDKFHLMVHAVKRANGE